MENGQDISVSLNCEEQALIQAAEKLSVALDVAIEVLEEVQKVVSGGRPKALKVKLGDRTLAEFPVALSATAAFVAGLAAVLLTKLAVEMDHED
ncbi:MAG: hypothetical protein GX139_05620 [Armatimonadetes bacterium]|jgi:hypothetical protein|nr:hypothetical protein [Armatimonadota bacterium]